MLVESLQHVNIRSTDADRARDFYVRILGLKVGFRPPFKSDGYWLYAGDFPLVHLVQRPAGETNYDVGSGNLDHVAFHGPDADAMRTVLTEEGISFRETTVPGEKITQFFFKDPDGVGLELSFDQP